MTPKLLPDKAYLQECFVCVGENLKWRVRPTAHFVDARAANSTNARFAGKVAGRLDSQGYRKLKLDGSWYAAHRIIHYLETGEQPPLVDHIDGCRTNNAPRNLRSATKSDNGANAQRSKRNTSGVKGVYFNKAASKWVARVGNGGSTYAGSYASLEEAAVAVRKVRNGLHKAFANHGEDE